MHDDPIQPAPPDDPTELLEQLSSDLMLKARYYPAPALLQPAFSERYAGCAICDTDPGDGDDYLVFKEMRGREPIVELVICASCMDVFEQVYSPRSSRAISTLFLASDWCGHARTRLEQLGEDEPLVLDRCALTGEPMDDQILAAGQRYQVVGINVGDGSITQLSFFPYLIGDAGIRRMEAVVSRESQDNWDRFLGQHQGLPPELRQLFNMGPPEDEPGRAGGHHG